MNNYVWKYYTQHTSQHFVKKVRAYVFFPFCVNSCNSFRKRHLLVVWKLNCCFYEPWSLLLRPVLSEVGRYRGVGRCGNFLFYWDSSGLSRSDVNFIFLSISSLNKKVDKPGKKTLSTKDARGTGYGPPTNKTKQQKTYWTLPHNIHKSSLEMVHRPKYKS